MYVYMYVYLYVYLYVYVCVCVYFMAFDLLPPAPFGTLVDGDCRLGTASWRLLARYSLLIVAQGKQQAGRVPRESFKRAPGGLQEGSGMVSGGPRGSSGSNGRTPGRSREGQRRP